MSQDHFQTHTKPDFLMNTKNSFSHNSPDQDIYQIQTKSDFLMNTDHLFSHNSHDQDLYQIQTKPDFLANHMIKLLPCNWWTPTTPYFIYHKILLEYKLCQTLLWTLRTRFQFSHNSHDQSCSFHLYMRINLFKLKQMKLKWNSINFLTGFS